MPRKFVLGDIKQGGLLALGAAILFGASTPAAKFILADIHPLMLAGLLYLGSGIGLSAIRLFRHKDGLRLKRTDLPWLLGTVLFGGVLGPALLMFGLQHTTGSTASLLLTLEGVFTATLAWVIFREPFNVRIGAGMLAIFGGAVLLSLNGPTGHAGLIGAISVASACLCWGVDNNLTQKISHVDAMTLAAIKGLVAGVTNVALALASGGKFPPLVAGSEAALVGLLGYGISLVLFVLALREIGAARSGAYFSTAPFIGAIIAVAAFGDPLTLSLGLAGLLMAAGVCLHFTEPAAEKA